MQRKSFDLCADIFELNNVEKLFWNVQHICKARFRHKRKRSAIVLCNLVNILVPEGAKKRF